MAFEYAGNDPPNDSDEVLNVTSDANVTKFRMTRTSRDSDEPANESIDPISDVMCRSLKSCAFRTKSPSVEDVSVFR